MGRLASQAYVDVTLESLSKIPDDAAKVKLILKLASKQKKNSDIEDLYKEALRIVDKDRDDTLKIKVLNAYGVYKRDISDYAEALDVHRHALELSRAIKSNNGEVVSLNNLGVVYRRLDENNVALNYHMDALKLAQKVNDHYNMSISLNSIGNIHIVLGNYRDAIVYFEECLPIARSADNNLGIAMNLNNIGEAYELMNKLDSAKFYYDSSLIYNRRIKSQKGIAICYNSIGSLYKKQGEFTDAIDLFQKALAINKELGDKLFLANTYNHLGDAYLGIKELSEAEQMFNSGLAIADSIGLRIEKRNSYRGLMDVFASKGDFQEALRYSKLQQVEADSLVYESNNRHVRQMEAIYKQENEKNQLALLEAKQRNTAIIVIGAVVLFILVLITVVLYFLRRRLIEKNLQLKRELQIRAQIARDLHDDMGSTLSSISIFSELLKHQPQDNASKDLINRIESNARQTMDALDDIIWLVKPDNDSLFNLSAHIQEYAVPMFNSKNIHFNIDFPDAISEIPLSMQTRKNIFLILKESVNNLVKYSHAAHATIEAVHKGDEIVFVVKDDGKGFDVNQQTTRNGLKNMKMRAEQIGAKFNIQSGLSNGTIIELRVKV
ncbi:MAG: tetratricopeptide repeat protein [Niabella sp.]